MVQVLLAMVIYFCRMDKSNLKSFFTAYGLQWQGRKSLVGIIQGFMCALSILVLLMVIEVFMGARIVHLNIHDTFFIKLLTYVGAAFIIGFIEEFFFRGMIFNKMKLASLPAAFIVTNIFYALVHFFKAHDVVIGASPTIIDSFRVIGALVQPFFSPVSILPGFIGLFIFGFVLSYAYWRSRSLYHSIGIHAGAVFFLKADGFFLNINDQMPMIIYGDKNVYTGILGWLFLGLMGLVIMYILRTFPAPTADSGQ